MSDLQLSPSVPSAPQSKTWYAEYGPHEIRTSEGGGRVRFRQAIDLTVRDVQTQLIVGSIKHKSMDGAVRLSYQCNTIAGSQEHNEDALNTSVHAAARKLWKEWNAALSRWQRFCRFWWRNKKRLVALPGLFFTAMLWTFGVVGYEAGLIGCLGCTWLMTSD